MKSYRNWIIAVATGLLTSLETFADANDETRPNVVIIFTDDQGYADLGVFGAKGFETPHIDRLASEGIRLTNFHVAQPVCSASRTALLTGCYPNRLGIHGALGPRNTHGIHAEETTLAEVAKGKGYATAIFGKWHLGHHKQFLPQQHGFDEYFGIPYSNDMWPKHPTAGDRFPPLPLIEGDTTIELNPDQSQLTTQITERAVAFIDRNKDRPFFLYVPHPMPHVPLFVSEKFKGKSEHGIYGDVIMEIDWSVGEIVAALKRNGLDRKTLVIFTSDNGPWLSYGTHGGSALPLREGKGTTFEGGVRVPFVAWWPGRIPAGSVRDEPMMTIDILPTITRLIGGQLPKRPIDGKDAWQLLSGASGARSPQEVYYIYYRTNELQAILSGRWKLHLPHRYRTLAGREGRSDGLPVEYSHKNTAVELYDLKSDISETRDLAAERPDIVAKLMKHVEAARQDLGDALTERPGANQREPGRIPKAN